MSLPIAGHQVCSSVLSHNVDLTSTTEFQHWKNHVIWHDDTLSDWTSPTIYYARLQRKRASDKERERAKKRTRERKGNHEWKIDFSRFLSECWEGMNKYSPLSLFLCVSVGVHAPVRVSAHFLSTSHCFSRCVPPAVCFGRTGLLGFQVSLTKKKKKKENRVGRHAGIWVWVCVDPRGRFCGSAYSMSVFVCPVIFGVNGMEVYI